MKVVDGRLFLKAIAVTGGIGSGKSRVARWLAHACLLPLYDADSEVKALLEKDEAGWQSLRSRLSPDFFDLEGNLRKAKLRQAIFVDEALRHAVEKDIHPLVLARLKSKISSGSRCLVEVPLLYEANWQDYFAEVLVVYAPEAVCCARIMSRDNISQNEALDAIRVQLTIDLKVSRADWVVDNGKDWSDTVCQLEILKKKWCPSSAEKKLDRPIV